MVTIWMEMEVLMIVDSVDVRGLLSAAKKISSALSDNNKCCKF